VVVFGASWCHKCTEEIPAIAKKYTKWKEQGVEVVFVSLDENKESFQQFTKDFAFPSTCDYKKWEGENVKNYYVFGTPTIFLLDIKREILLRPNSVQQMDSWVDWHLIQHNPLPK
jgi:thiol-disulfide isomerase/thioredoxin